MKCTTHPPTFYTVILQISSCKHAFSLWLENKVLIECFRENKLAELILHFLKK